MKDAKKFWDGSADKYVKSPIKDKDTYNQKLKITRSYLQSDWKVFEFGCGSGATALLHAPNVSAIVATDISDKMIDLARQRSAREGVENISFNQGTLADFSHQNGAFDAVLGLNVLHLLDDIDDAIRRVHQLLKREGIFISSTSLVGEIGVMFRWLITLMQVLGLAPYVCRLTQAQLVEKLRAGGFSIETEWRCNRESVFIVARKAAEEVSGAASV